MRIIAGKLRGLRFKTPAGRRVRPTGERLRESLFSSLGEACREAEVVDLFAGCGVLGFEAWSRGGRRVTFVEKDRAVVGILKSNARALGVEESCKIVCADVFTFLQKQPAAESNSLIFADPPFEKDFVRPVLSWWQKNSLKGALLVLQYPAPHPPAGEVKELQPVKSATFGESSYSIYLAD